MDFTVVIPARFGSTRLPGKPLLEAGGKPLIRWTYECAGGSTARRVVVATDDRRIAECVRSFGGEVCMTRDDHASGSDRIAETVGLLGMSADHIIVNLQGDEPAMPGGLIDQVAATLVEQDQAAMATACHECGKSDLDDPNVVKVVRGHDGMALYFSRAPIPWPRHDPDDFRAWRHIGIYAYRCGYLLEFNRRPRSHLERIERLEQLRALEYGDRIAVCDARDPPGPGVDTLQDLETFRATLSLHPKGTDDR